MRINWIDIAKAYGMILVFYGHILEREIQFGSDSAFLQFKFIYAFHMPLFFMLAGYVSKNKKLDLKYRFATKIIPFLFFNLLALPFIVINDFIEGRFKLTHYLFGIVSFVKGYPLFNFITWFLVCLFTVEIVDVVLHRYIKTNKGLITAAVCLYSLGWFITWKSDLLIKTTGIEENFWFIHEALVAYLFYQIGSCFKQYGFLEEEKRFLRELSLAIIAGLFLLCTFNVNTGPFLYNPYVVDMAGSQHGNPILFPLTAIAGSLFIIYLAKLTPVNEVALFIGKNTLVLLGINGLFYDFFNERYVKLTKYLLADSNLAVVAICGLGTLGSLIFSVPLILLLNKFLPQLVGKPRNNGPILKNLV